MNYPTYGGDMLVQMMARQSAAQAKYHDGDKLKSTEDKISDIMHNAFALLDEVHEAMGEVGWKRWATSRHINDEAFKNELIDAWHFMMNLFELAGMSADEVYERYNAKRDKNDKRQQDGYDGVSTKCKGCGRALDDDAVKCHVMTTTLAADDGRVISTSSDNWCDKKQEWL